MKMIRLPTLSSLLAMRVALIYKFALTSLMSGIKIASFLFKWLVVNCLLARFLLILHRIAESQRLFLFSRFPLSASSRFLLFCFFAFLLSLYRFVVSPFQEDSL